MTLIVADPPARFNVTDLCRMLRNSAEDVTGVVFGRKRVLLYFLDEDSARRALSCAQRNCPELYLRVGRAGLSACCDVELRDLPGEVGAAEIKRSLDQAGISVPEAAVEAYDLPSQTFRRARIRTANTKMARAISNHFSRAGVAYFDSESASEKVHHAVLSRISELDPEKLHRISIADQTAATQRVFTPKRAKTTESLMWRRATLHRRIEHGVFAENRLPDRRRTRPENEVIGAETEYYEMFKQNDRFYDVVGRRWKAY